MSSCGWVMYAPVSTTLLHFSTRPSSQHTYPLQAALSSFPCACCGLLERMSPRAPPCPVGGVGGWVGWVRSFQSVGAERRLASPNQEEAIASRFGRGVDSPPTHPPYAHTAPPCAYLGQGANGVLGGRVDGVVGDWMGGFSCLDTGAFVITTSGCAFFLLLPPYRQQHHQAQSTKAKCIVPKSALFFFFPLLFFFTQFSSLFLSHPPVHLPFPTQRTSHTTHTHTHSQ